MIIVGFGRFGQIVGRLLYANKIKVTILESDASQVRLLRKYGYKVFYGDATNLELLRAAGVEQAEALVVCTDDPEQVITIVELCQQHFPNLKLLARARSRVEAYQLMSLGVQNYTRETFLSALDLGRKAWFNLACILIKRNVPKSIFIVSIKPCSKNCYRNIMKINNSNCAPKKRVPNLKKYLAVRWTVTSSHADIGKRSSTIS